MKAKLTKTTELKKPNPYAVMLMDEYEGRAFDEDKVQTLKGKWRKELFQTQPNDYPIDVEIGTGNGYFFAHRSSTNLDRGLLGFEVKYKPLIQAMRRALRAGAKENAYMLRYNAYELVEVFEKEEINNVFIHHPDPWPRKKHWKHRLIQDDFLKELMTLMKPGSFVEFKTDDEPYFDWALERFQRSDFTMDFITRDLHNSKLAEVNFKTHFEKIFLAKGQPIFYLKVFKK